MADVGPPPTSSGPGDIPGPTVVHKVKSKLGYTEMHTTAPGFNEEVRDGFLIIIYLLL